MSESRSIGAGGRYASRGVSATKSDVHAAIAEIDRGLFPGAFCKITEDVLTGDSQKCNVIHADGSGTKSILAYLWYRETGDASVFRGIAHDSVVMNVDDLLCVGATRGILLSSTINRNAKRIPGAVIAELIQGTEECLETLRRLGLDIRSGGGETADVGDLTPTVVVDSCATAVLSRGEVITGAGVRPGLAIVGLASSGRANYESRENSGIGSNGLTSARHDMLSPYYRTRFPETWDSQVDESLVYCGAHKLEDPLAGSSLTVGEALLSPTRSYAPVIVALLEDQRRSGTKVVEAIVHCSGGGQTKCLHFGAQVHFVKDALLPIPPIFRAIQGASGTTWKEMYQVYNMGHRMEVFCPEAAVKTVLETAARFGVEASRIGRTERSRDGRNRLTIVHESGELEYSR